MKKYNIAVIGGGFAGVAAAISAARGGASVILIEKSGCLGGAASNCLVQPFMYYSTKIGGENVELCRGIFKEITDGLEKMAIEIDGAERGYLHEEYLKILLNRMVLKAGVELLFHSYLISSKAENGTVTSVTAANKSGSTEIFADYFIDATGDADLAYMSGFSCRLGRDADNLCQPMTLCFRLSNVDIKAYHENCETINELYTKFQKEGKIKNPRENVLIFSNPVDGVLHFNTTRIIKLNPVDAFDLTKAEIEAREQVLEMFLFMKNNIRGFENSRLVMTAAEIGVRESRMIDGEYVLTGSDLKACTQFEDAIALGNYDIDIHNPEGSGTSHYYFPEGEFYSVPYRCLIPKNAKNFLVAGRCISADHDAQASIRIMPIVCCLGEAAGAAAAIAYKSKTDVKSVDIKLLRDTLKRSGAVTEI